jgi:hypothetical protein
MQIVKKTANTSKLNKLGTILTIYWQTKCNLQNAKGIFSKKEKNPQIRQRAVTTSPEMQTDN